MYIVNFCVRTGRILAQIDWQEVGLIVFHGLIALMVLIYVVAETIGKWVHRTNDWLAHHWVRLIVPSSPDEGQAPIVEEVSATTLPTVEVELKLPPVPLVIQDPWTSPIEVKLMLPLAPMAILFAAPLALAAAQAPVALLAAGQPVSENPFPATNGRRRRVKSQPTQATTTTPRPRGRRAHANRK